MLPPPPPRMNFIHAQHLPRNNGGGKFIQQRSAGNDSGPPAGYRDAPMTAALRVSLYAVLAFGIFAAGVAQAAPIDGNPKVQASLIVEQPSVAPGGQLTVALREVIRQGWHTYWRNPGDSGQPTSIVWHLPAGWQAGPIQWPYPKRLPVGPLMDYGFENEVALLSTLTAPSGAKPGAVHITADVQWLVCAEVCIPEETKLALDLTVATAAPAPDVDTASFFARARARLPEALNAPASYSVDDAAFTLNVPSPLLAAAHPRDAFFYPDVDGYVANAAKQELRVMDAGVELAAKPGWKLEDASKRAAAGAVSGVLVFIDGYGVERAVSLSAQNVTPAAPPLVATGIGFIEALLFAFLGGLILNLMPCVLPVLSIKALALARKGGAAEKAQSEALAYGVGVVLSFVALGGLLIALRAGGEAVGWGFQLQDPMVVASFALLIFAVGLNLSGVFDIGESITGFGEHLVRHGGLIGSFFTGVLAVAVAAPCTAPFMGAAMGFALTQPAGVALGVFVALALGFAAPFVALGFSPGLLRLLPKPGAWMETLRQLLAFPMYATAIWLGWVLSLEAGLDGVVVLMAAALALAFALWAFGAAKKARARGRILAWIAVMLGLAAVAYLLPMADTGKHASLQQSSALPSQPYSAARLASLRAEGRPVFVNATAAWCITCLVNERLSLGQKSVAEIFARNNVAYLVADWTNRDAEVSALLAAHGRTGVPLYLYYPPHAAEPVVLPQILTENVIRSTLESGK
jgi:thiol:disulfide interchange protein